MVLSTQTSYIGKVFGDEAAVKLFADAGFRTLDFSFFQMSHGDCIMNTDGYKEYAQGIRKAADKCGVTFNQSHAPFTFDWQADGALENVARPRIIRSMEISSILGVGIIVIHPIHHMVYKGNEQNIRAINMEYYKGLAPYAKKYNLKIAVENMWQRDSLRKYIVDDVCSKAEELASYVDELNAYENCFVACLDLGHVGLVGEKAEDAIRILGGKRLKSLHVHDNNYQSDDHTLPGLGKMDWRAITAALSDIGYDGEFTLEADKFLFGFDKELLPAALKFMYDNSRFWADKIK